MAMIGFFAHGLADKVFAAVTSLIIGVSLGALEGVALSGPTYAIALLVSYLAISGVVDGFVHELTKSSRLIAGTWEVPSPALRPRVRLAIRVGIAWV